MLCATDLLPAFLSLAGQKFSETSGDGVNIAALLLGKPKERTMPIFWEYGRNDISFRYPAGRDRSPNFAMRQGNWKLLTNDDGTRTELYNLTTDPAEKTDLAEKQPAIVKDMKTKLLAWRGKLPKVKH